MKKQFVKWDSIRRLKRRIRTPYLPFSQAKNIVIIENREIFTKPEIDDLVVQLEREGKQVSRFYLIQKKVNISNRYSDYPFAPSDYSIIGQIKNPELSGLLSKKFDFALVFDIDDNIWVSNLCTHILSDCFIGTGPTNFSLIDFQISVERQNMVTDFLHYIRLFLK